MSLKQHFRGVIWPRGKAKGKSKQKTTVYRYIVVGMLVTDKPLDGIEGKNEIVLDGFAAGMDESLQVIKQKPANIRIGDANDVLYNLGRICE